MFQAAYQQNADWAIANLTTWLVYIGALAAIANLAVVITAFYIQERQFKREKRVRDSEKARLYGAAIRACRNALEIYDVTIGGKDNIRHDFSRSDLAGRISTFQNIIRYYLNLGIINPGLVDCLFTVQTLLDRVYQDLKDLLPLEQDRFPSHIADQLYNHRRLLRDGTEKIIGILEASPAIDPEVL